jgi:hypothetical protein
VLVLATKDSLQHRPSCTRRRSLSWAGRRRSTVFRPACLPAVIASDPVDWFRRPKHTRPGICGQRQLLVVDDIQG